MILKSITIIEIDLNTGQVFMLATTNEPTVTPAPAEVKEPVVAEVPLNNEQKFATRTIQNNNFPANLICEPL